LRFYFSNRGEGPTRGDQVVSELLKKVASVNNLTPQESASAETRAAAWVYLGPCQGDFRKFKDAPNRDTLAWVKPDVLTADPSRPMDAAMLTMITILIRELFSGPTLTSIQYEQTYACRFALETALPNVPVGSPKGE
jgi:hypothetical protein